MNNILSILYAVLFRAGREYGRIAVTLSLAFALLPAARAQRHSLIYTPDSPEGQFLELIQLTEDVPKRIRLLQDFVARYPQHKSYGWALGELLAFHLDKGEHDNAIAVAEKLLGLEPEDLDSARIALQCSEQKKDPMLVKKWSATVQAIARKLADGPPLKDPMIAESWELRTKVASQLVARSEFELLQKALSSPDSRVRIDILDGFVKQYPNSQYMPQVHLTYLQAYRALGNHTAAAGVARKVLASDPENEDALFVVADASLRAGAYDRVMSETSRLIATMEKKRAPEGVRAEDWNSKKTLYLGTAHWMRGNVYVNQEKFSGADAELRESLPLMKGNSSATAAILFYLGWSNYRLERYKEAARYFRQCQAYDSQYRDQATKNLEIIKNEQSVVPEED